MGPGACLPGGRRWLLWGWVCPLPLPLPPTSSGDGPALLWSFSVPLFWEQPVVCSGRFSPLLSHSLKKLPPTALRAFWPVLTLSNAARSSPFRPHLLVLDAGIWGTFLLGVAFRHVICGPYLISPPSYEEKLPSDPPARGSPGDWKLPLLKLPSRDGSLSLALLSLFLSFIFCPTSLQRQWVAFLGAWCPLLAIRSCFVKFAQCSIVLSMNL